MGLCCTANPMVDKSSYVQFSKRNTGIRAGVCFVGFDCRSIAEFQPMGAEYPITGGVHHRPYRGLLPMETAVIQVLGTILVALITSIVSLLVFRRQEKRQDRKDNIDNADTISESAIGLFMPYKQEVTDLRTSHKIETAEMKASIKALEVDILRERDKRRELEIVVRDQLAMITQKDQLIINMQNEITSLRLQVDELKTQISGG